MQSYPNLVSEKAKVILTSLEQDVKEERAKKYEGQVVEEMDWIIYTWVSKTHETLFQETMDTTWCMNMLMQKVIPKTRMGLGN